MCVHVMPFAPFEELLIRRLSWCFHILLRCWRCAGGQDCAIKAVDALEKDIAVFMHDAASSANMVWSQHRARFSSGQFLNARQPLCRRPLSSFKTRLSS